MNADVRNLDDYSEKLTLKIINSQSFEQVKRFLLTAYRSLKEHEINGHLINRFTDKMTIRLDRVRISNSNTIMTLNAQFAKIQLEAYRKKIKKGELSDIFFEKS